MVALRPGPVVAATEYWTSPFPVPDAPDVTEIQAAPLAAVQAHPSPAVTVTFPVPPAEATDALVGAMVYAHPAPCEIVTR